MPVLLSSHTALAGPTPIMLGAREYGPSMGGQGTKHIREMTGMEYGVFLKRLVVRRVRAVGHGSRPRGRLGAVDHSQLSQDVGDVILADRGMMGGSGQGVNAGMGLVDGVDHT